MRPVLKPALVRFWRDASCVQLGLEPPHGVVLEGVSDAAATVLDLLDGSRDWPGVLAVARERGCDPADTEALLETLLRQGLLDDAASAPDGIPVDELDRLRSDLAQESLLALQPGGASLALARMRAARIVVVGAGRVGSAVSLLLAAAGVSHVTVCDPRPAKAWDGGPAGFTAPRDTRTRAYATASAAARKGSRGVRASPLTPDDPRLYAGASAVVLAPDVYSGPEPAVEAALVATGVPYVMSGVRETRGIVGPLVLPGRTSCARCHDLLRTERDPAWPLIAAQLSAPRSGSVTACGVELATAIAALTAAQVHDLVAGRRVAVLGATLEIGLPDWQMHRRAWRIHPACGCTASTAACDAG
jgi:molybdopterin/thiamine biosynthesis adenylyltransferase